MAHAGRKKADEALASLLAAGQTLRAAAPAVGVSERTAARRWADPAFRRRVAGLQHDLVARSLGRLADGMSEAVDVLRGLLAARSESVRLGAARAILEFGIRGRDTVELGVRVRELEEFASLHQERLGHE